MLDLPKNWSMQMGNPNDSIIPLTIRHSQERSDHCFLKTKIHVMQNVYYHTALHSWEDELTQSFSAAILTSQQFPSNSTYQYRAPQEIYPVRREDDRNRHQAIGLPVDRPRSQQQHLPQRREGGSSPDGRYNRARNPLIEIVGL